MVVKCETCGAVATNVFGMCEHMRGGLHPKEEKPDPDVLLKLTAAMRAQGVANFKYGEAHVAFWQPMPVATADLRNVDPGADTALYSERDLFGDDPEDPDRGLPK